jgi:membrane protein YqaA with SNARE-associated domain
MPDWINQLLDLLSMPQYGLSTVFVVSFISATLLPLGSEPVVFGVVHLNPEQFWPAVLVATAGNTLGGALDWWIGYGAHKVARQVPPLVHHTKALDWLEKLGPQSLPAGLAARRGRPAVRGGGLAQTAVLALSGYMAIGKFGRYVTMTATLMGLVNLW